MKRKIDVETPEEDKKVNQFTGKPYSNRYYEILKGRQGADCLSRCVCLSVSLRCSYEATTRVVTASADTSTI
jgi:protein-disulfide isomerase-like protein with CxxC motif